MHSIAIQCAIPITLVCFFVCACQHLAEEVDIPTMLSGSLACSLQLKASNGCSNDLKRFFIFLLWVELSVRCSAVSTLVCIAVVYIKFLSCAWDDNLINFHTWLDL